MHAQIADPFQQLQILFYLAASVGPPRGSCHPRDRLPTQAGPRKTLTCQVCVPPPIPAQAHTRPLRSTIPLDSPAHLLGLLRALGSEHQGESPFKCLKKYI